MPSRRARGSRFCRAKPRGLRRAPPRRTISKASTLFSKSVRRPSRGDRDARPSYRRRASHAHRRADGPGLSGQGFLSRVRRRHVRGRRPLAGAELLPARERAADDVDPFLAAAHGQAHDPGRCLQRQSQAAPRHAALQHARHAVSWPPARGGRRARGDRLRDVHASARRSRRLEHTVGERQVGADLSQRQVRDVAHRPRPLGDAGQEGRYRGIPGQHLQRFGAADRRGEEGRVRVGRSRHVRLPHA